MKTERVEADVLCVGGGIAGLMAAVSASERGAKVVVAEKSNTLRSGAGGSGNDHFICYIPEAHGPNIEALIKDMKLGQNRVRMEDEAYARLWLERAFDMVKLWESWGIPMKYEGRYEFAGHRHPGHLGGSLKYAGQMQKPILTKQTLDHGAKIVNRVMVFELLGGADGVTGALGIDTREDRLIEFQAKSVILGTGSLGRLYLGLTPALLNNIHMGLSSLAGDGRAMAYRLGAELVNMDRLERGTGLKNFCRQGKGTWVGVFKDPQGKPVGPYLTTPDRRYSDMVGEIDTQMFEKYTSSGRGPLYLDHGGISEEDYEFMMHWVPHEGNSAILNNLDEEGLDFRKNQLEWVPYPISGGGQIRCDLEAETSVKGLYAAGDEAFGTISGAATFGWIAGENAAEYAKKVEMPDIEKEKAIIEEKQDLIAEIRSRSVGPDWKEANIALQHAMNDYAGSIRSETLLEAGITHMRRLREKARNTIVARNQHEVMRSLEVFNLLDLGELVFIAAKERKETRGLHTRVDYPYTNILLDNKVVVVKKTGEKPIAELKEKSRDRR
ncbi:FAD-binding protein [Chloroflexota bacterium]